jgi:DNA-binding response OmpR family regulator
MKILLAEDDLKLGKLIVRMLTKEMYSVDWVTDGEDAYDYASSTTYDVVIFDWMLPSISGIEASQRLRTSGYEGAILMLTARDTLEDRVAGLDSGVDDYLVKPFEFKELFARIRALSRRMFVPIEQEIVKISDMVIDLRNHRVRCEDRVLSLTPKEFQLLELLVRNRNQVLPKEMIIERVWGYDREASSNTLEACMKLLRKKLDPLGEKKYIRTVRGVGYVLEDFSC